MLIDRLIEECESFTSVTLSLLQEASEYKGRIADIEQVTLEQIELVRKLGADIFKQANMLLQTK